MSNKDLNVLVLFKNISFALVLIRYLINFDSDIKISAISRNRSFLKWSRYVNNFAVIDFSKMDKNCLKKINEFCTEKNIDIIIPSDIESSFFLSKFKNNLICKTFPIADKKNLEILNNKWLFYNFLLNLNILTPGTVLINREKDKKNIKGGFMEFPVILKPLNKGGGEGVEKIEDQNQLLKVILSSKYSQLIKQKFIAGQDIDLSVLAINGKIIAHTIQIRKKEGIEFLEDKKILDIGKKIISKLRYNGLVHFDMRKDFQNSIYMVEANPRIWASIVASLIIGTDFIGMGLKKVQKSIILKPRLIQSKYLWPRYSLYRFITQKGSRKVLRKNIEEIKTIIFDPISLFALSYNTLKIIFKK